jgi:hypothetical protein
MGCTSMKKPRRCTYLRAVLCAICMQHMHGVSGEAVSRVSTAADLKDALMRGARDIEVTAHLDLTQLAPGMAAVFDRPKFRSIRVRCWIAFVGRGYM